MRNILLLLYLHWMMAIRVRPARYIAAKTLRTILQSDDNLVDSDISDAESDQVSESRDHSDIEYVEPARYGQNADKPEVPSNLIQPEGVGWQ